MQVLNTGTSYKIYDASIKAYDKLPANIYRVVFNPMEGFSLVLSDSLSIKEKIYGSHLAKVNKVFSSFEDFPRNLGVILSGDKGIGKSLFAKLLANKAIDNGYPVIICDTYYKGIANFIGSIMQEVMILFDEFDKTFDKRESFDPQVEMLSLFDGVYESKKLFVITCNEYRRLNSFLINRPGRFHYHFRFEYPNDEEIREYLQDSIDSEYWGQITDVIEFSHKIKLNYDCLRAIAFELNLGLDFNIAIKDLNIINDSHEEYTILMRYKDGTIVKDEDEFDLFSGNTNYAQLSNKNTPTVEITFDSSAVQFDPVKKSILLIPEQISIMEIDEYQDYKNKIENYEDRVNYLADINNIDFINVKLNSSNEIHYIF